MVKIQRLFAKTNLKIPVCRTRSQQGLGLHTPQQEHYQSPTNVRTLTSNSNKQRQGIIMAMVSCLLLFLTTYGMLGLVQQIGTCRTEKLMKELIQRCSWATTDLYKEYHDNEWGKPVHDENKLFEMLILEGMQAGLSWLTILNKREAFRIAFDNFDCKKIALYDDAKIEKLMQNSRIVRNRLKIKSAITNAQQFIKIQESYGSFDSFIWSYVDGKPILNQFQTETDIPARTALSDQISKDLKKLGFKFVGSTIIYAYMQAIGIVNDHVKGCHLYANK